MDDPPYNVAYGNTNHGSPYAMAPSSTTMVSDYPSYGYQASQAPRMVPTNSNQQFVAADIANNIANMSLAQPRFNPAATEFYPKTSAFGDGTPVSSPRVNRTRSPAVHTDIQDPHGSRGANAQYYFAEGQPDGDYTIHNRNQDHSSTDSGPLTLAFPPYSQYTGEPPHLAHFKSDRPSLFHMNNEIKRDLLHRQAQVLSIVQGPAATDLPEQCDKYCEITPMESVGSDGGTGTLHYHTTAYKAINKETGKVYSLRRLHSYKLQSLAYVKASLAAWKLICHPNIVTLREVFTTKSFGDNSVVFVYDYHPGSDTVAAKYLSNTSILNGYSSPYNLDGAARPYSAGKTRRQNTGCPEDLLWQFAIQLLSAVGSVHSKQRGCPGVYAFRCIRPSKVLLTDKCRLRINCGGLIDILTSDHSQNNPMPLRFQREDIQAIGTLLMQIACGSHIATHPEHMQSSFDMIRRVYSRKLSELIKNLITPKDMPTVDFISQCCMPCVGPQYHVMIEALLVKADSLEDQLMRECESGRLLRITAKLNSILDRQLSNDQAGGERWSETGDRYILKLFRDYVFHQKDERGRNWINMAHVVSCLNKLDAGTSERICLNTPSMNTVILVTYAELKKYFESSFKELIKDRVE